MAHAPQTGRMLSVAAGVVARRVLHPLLAWLVGFDEEEVARGDGPGPGDAAGRRDPGESERIFEFSYHTLVSARTHS